MPIVQKTNLPYTELTHLFEVQSSQMEEFQDDCQISKKNNLIFKVY